MLALGPTATSINFRLNNSGSSGRIFNKEYIYHCVLIITVITIFIYQHINQATGRAYSYNESEEHPLFFTNETPPSHLDSFLRSLSLNNATKAVSERSFDTNFNELVMNAQKYLFVQFLKSKTFIGTWTSNSSELIVGNEHTGRAQLRFNVLFDLNAKEEVFLLYFKCYEDDYIDNWLTLSSFTNLNSLMSNVSYANTTNATSMTFNSSFTTHYEKGKIFTRTFLSSAPCDSLVSLSFASRPINISIKNEFLNKTKNFTINSVDPSNVNITFLSQCGMNLTLRASHNETAINEVISQINVYSLIIITTCLLSMFASFLLAKQLNKRDSNVTSISLITACQGFIWHAYCCISNITFGLTYPAFILRFTSVSVVNMICFCIFDLKLMYTYWQIRQRQTQHDTFLRSKFRFYIVFYAIFFCSFFILIKAFYDKVYITVMLLMLWLPQIVFNIIKNNKVGLPLIYVLICTLDRIGLPFYFRGYNGNLFRIRQDWSFVCGWSLFLVGNVVVMYLQLFIGSRFLLPKAMRGNVFEYYKSKEEVMKMKSNAKELECVICLQKMMADNEDDGKSVRNEKEMKRDDSGTGYNSLISDSMSVSGVLNGNRKDGEEEEANKHACEDALHTFPNASKDVELKVITSTSSEDDFDFHRQRRKNYKRGITWKQVIHVANIIQSVCFTFYKVPKNKTNKPFMVTPCGHVFHTQCLEEWFNCKKECPNCRAVMQDY